MRVANSLSFADVVATNKPAEGPVGVPPQAADVAIVGGGPIGLLAANLLGLHNVKTVVIERMGLYEALQPHLTSVPFGIHFYSPLGFELVKAEGFITPNGFANRNSVSQPMLEKILLQNLQRFGGVTVCYRQSVKALSQTDDGV